MNNLIGIVLKNITPLLRLISLIISNISPILEILEKYCHSFTSVCYQWTVLKKYLLQNMIDTEIKLKIKLPR